MGNKAPIPSPNDKEPSDKQIKPKPTKNHHIYNSIYDTVLWLDENYDDKENTKNQIFFRTNFEDLSLNLETFKEIDKVLNIIMQKEFKIIFVIISGKLYEKYYLNLKKIKNEITSIPLTIIFTSTKRKNVLLRKNNTDESIIINKEMLDSIGNSFYNYGKVTDNKDDVVNFIKKFLGLKSKSEVDYSHALTFEIINDFEQLIIPSLYNKIEMYENEISEEDIEEFNNTLIIKHDYTERGISELITLYKKIGSIPLEILTKYWVNYYTSESSFYTIMNLQFMKNDYTSYEIFVKALYKGLELNFLSPKTDKILHRFQLISRKEFQNILEALKNKKNIQLYSRTFLSFSLNRNKALNFLKKNTDDLISIELRIKPQKNGEIFSSNAYISPYSVYKGEEEVLFFPFSSFIIDEEIKTEINKKIETKVIMLNYLGKYEQEIKIKMSNTFNKLSDDLNFDIIDKGINNNWKFVDDMINKKEGEKFKKNLDEIKDIVNEEIKNIVKGKNKHKYYDKNYIAHQ